MCKIMVMPSVKKEFVENAWKFCQEIAPFMSKNDDDGFGYAAMEANGKVFGERWLNNVHAMKDNCGMSKGDVKLFNILGQKLVKENISYNKFGKINKGSIVSIMLHARRATSPRGLVNTHPFVKGDTAIIHNGMIRNHDELKKEFSTCDSEVILHEYLDNEVAQDPKLIQMLVDTLEGYYAVGVLAKDSKNIPIVDVFKSSAASLHCVYIDELDCVVFCTEKDIVEQTLKNLNWKQNKFFEFNESGYIRFNALTGENMYSEVLNKTVVPPKHQAWLDRQKNFPNTHSHYDDIDSVIDQYKDEDIDYVKLIEEDERERINKSVAMYHGNMS